MPSEETKDAIGSRRGVSFPEFCHSQIKRRMFVWRTSEIAPENRENGPDEDRDIQIVTRGCYERFCP